ncbi:hypothetical protein CRE_08824 [Caenorhabditis remanei]|uniref:Uncharacterized protein n=1 Tax=Caenorhabditis remanei TaxID=31234 RepID=E3LHR1_CAERE|nr:hypothetical protein CRE_08824 [Caenorhabditis remanei]
MVEIYYWSKNSGPRDEKDHDRNKFCRFFMSFLKTEAVIMKTYHLDASTSSKIWKQFDHSLARQDLVPFVKYSLNKKKRWEVQGGVSLLKELKDAYDDMNVLVANRVCLRSSPYFCVAPAHHYFLHFFRYFPIRHLHRMNSDSSYQCQSGSSIWGQSYKSLLPENRRSEKTEANSEEPMKPTVVYHIIIPPKNYEKLRNNDFRFTSSHSIVHIRRCKNMKDILMELRYDEHEELEDGMDIGDDYATVDSRSEPRKFTKSEGFDFSYNLVDHVVDPTVWRY